MPISHNERNNGGRTLDRNEILRIVVADAESMGLRDREKIEWLTNQVIERLEAPHTLPGMESLVSKQSRRQLPEPTSDQIQDMLKELSAV